MCILGLDQYGFFRADVILIFFSSALVDDRYGLLIFLSQNLEPILLLLPQFTS